MAIVNKPQPYNCHNVSLTSTINTNKTKMTASTMPKPVDTCSHDPLVNNSQLKRFLARRTQCEEEAADLYQESVVRVLEQAKKSTISNPVAYAISIAKNLLTQRTQKNEGDIDDIAAANGDPEHSLQDAQRIALIYQALKQMPEQRRRVFELRRINGESREAIALQLNISADAVTRHTSRAMVDIQRYLEMKTK